MRKFVGVIRVKFLILGQDLGTRLPIFDHLQNAKKNGEGMPGRFGHMCDGREQRHGGGEQGDAYNQL